LREDLSQSGGRSLIHALLDLLFRETGPVPADAFLVTATTKAGIDNLERLRHGILADPDDILLASIPDIVSQKLGLERPAINISAACASSAIAVARGAALIATGRADAVLVCCLDVVTEFVFSGFSSLGALSPVPCMPFDRDRNGLSLGEGAAALMLMSRERAVREGRPHLGTVSGWGIAGDAHHITAPARDGRGLIKAVGLALHSAMINEEDISVISAHGTGTVYNDLMELTAFGRVFGRRRLPVYSVKGAIGHTMGAAGGIEVALGLKTLSEQVVPPTVGLSNPEDDAAGLVSPFAREMTGDYLLTTNSGFGGTNAAIILKRGKET
ncbi:MAG: beta-ketoacyl-[acyl-carrier-protein] synthase family protein, partial [Deltaproteobacteria bacterium]|nr:beta-ketoacyl-[acyl-carrier-protein] synthase family protein [Deltaproteobacteria bacterium]